MIKKLKALVYKLSGASISSAIRLLSRSEKKKLGISLALQLFLTLLDLVALSLMGLLGAIAVSGFTSQKPGRLAYELLDILNLQNMSFQVQVGLLGFIAAVFLVARSVISMVLTRRMLHFLGRRGSIISQRIFANVMNKPITFIQSSSQQELLYSMTQGVYRLMVGVLGSTLTAVVDIFLLATMTVGLFIYDPFIAVCSFLLFGGVGLLLYLQMNVKAGKLGDDLFRLNVRSNQEIIEVFNTYREAVVKNRRPYYIKKISDSRTKIADAESEVSFMPIVSKYILEASIIIGGLLVAGLQFSLKDASHAAAALAIFLTAGSRIAPSALRLQQSAIMIKTSAHTAQSTISLIHRLGPIQTLNSDAPVLLNIDHEGFNPWIEIKHLTYAYPGADKNALEDICVSINPGTHVAIVGSSGAGKTTLVDAILGVLEIESDSILISGKSSLNSVNSWPGAISYVPQDITIVDGTIRENIILGYDKSEVPEGLLEYALDRASLTEWVNALPEGVESQVGDFGTNLSGGQRQRVGIARALLTKPKLLILDEATSSLDAQTESEISKAIMSMKGTTTVISIAHRLSTVVHADLVLYLSEGRIVASGNFEEVRSLVPNFDQNAKLLGL